MKQDIYKDFKKEIRSVIRNFRKKGLTTFAMESVLCDIVGESIFKHFKKAENWRGYGRMK